jgi:LacI family transcriptional regulator
VIDLDQSIKNHHKNNKMPKHPTIKDLAKAAGVSTATVDRVLNSRTSVRLATTERVLKAASDIGYHGANLIRMRLEEARPKRHLAFLLQRSNDQFYQQFATAIQQAVLEPCSYNFTCEIRFMEEVSPSSIAQQLRSLSGVDGVGIVALENSQVTQELEKLTDRGIPVINLLSDMATLKKSGFVGWDSRKVGRTAAWTIHRLSKKTGSIGILLGSHRYLGQQEAETSFINYFREIEAGFTVLPTLLNLDDDKLTAQATSELLEANPDLVGIYNAGGGRAGMIDTLRNEAAERELVVVCQELTGETKSALLDGVIDLVIGTPIKEIARETIKQFQTVFNDLHADRAATRLPADLFISENV